MLLLGTTLLVVRLHMHLDTADEFVGFRNLRKGLLEALVQLSLFLM